MLPVDPRAESSIRKHLVPLVPLGVASPAEGGSHGPTRENTMATDSAFAQHVCDQLSDLGEVSCRKMFGEYALYLGDRVVALICDNQLFLKPTEAGRALLGAPAEAPPYPGAKPYFVLDEHLDDRQLLSATFSATAAALPAPRPKSGRKPKPPKAPPSPGA
jgi:DNA transformation protein and related proteins